MGLRKKSSVPRVRLPFLKLRSFKNNRYGVSNVLGYTFSVAVAAMLMVSSVFMLNGVVDDKTNQVAEIEAQNIANYVANAIAEAVSVKQAMPTADYYKKLDLPNKIAGKDYTVEVTETEVYVKTIDGSTVERCSTYNIEGGGSGILPTVTYGGNGKITLSYNELDYVIKLDFGQGDILSHSPVEAGYYFVSPESGPDWYEDNMPYRIPISITNPTYDELDDIPVKIVLNETNFDYDHVTYNSPGGSILDADPTGQNLQPNLVLFDSEPMIENEIDISASVSPSVWYPHWKYSSISINDIGPFDDPDDIMEIEKDTFKVILTFADDPSGPNSTYVWYNAKDEPPLHSIKFGTSLRLIDCISYTPNYEGDIYTGMAEFYLEDAFTTFPNSSVTDGGTQNFKIEGYYLDKTTFSIPCSITIKYGDYYVKKGGGGGAYSTIQAAIDASETNQDPETGKVKTVFVYGDTYYEQVNINKNINLVGANWKSTIEASKEDYVVRVAENVDNAIISSFVIRNGGTGNEEDEVDGLELDGCSNVIVTDCEMKKNYGRGIVIYNGSQKNIIRKCNSHDNIGHWEDMQGMYYPGRIKDGDGLVITDDNNDDTKYNYVLESIFHDCDNFDSDGIVIKNGADYNKIEKCRIYNIDGVWSKGIDIVNNAEDCDGPSENVIKDCNVYNVRGGNYVVGIGIWVDPEYGDTDHCPINNTIMGGEIYNVKGMGLGLYCTDNNTIKDAKIYDNYGGIWTLAVDHLTVENCDIYGNKNVEIYIPIRPQSKSSGDGIYFDLYSDHNIVRNCDIYSNEGSAIYVGHIYNESEEESYNNSNIVIEYCNIYDNEAGGFLKPGAIVFSCVKNAVVRHCNIYSNSHNGLLLSILCKFNQIEYNNFYCNEEYGVKIGMSVLASDNNINNNNFAYNNGEYAEAYDGTEADDDWEYNYWEGHNPDRDYVIPGFYGGDVDHNPKNAELLIKIFIHYHFILLIYIYMKNE